jgi:hypothetical protein
MALTITFAADLRPRGSAVTDAATPKQSSALEGARSPRSRASGHGCYG